MQIFLNLLLGVASGIISNWVTQTVFNCCPVVLCFTGEDHRGASRVEEIHFRDDVCLQMFSLVHRAIAEILCGRGILAQSDFKTSFYEPLGVTTSVLMASSQLGKMFSDLLEKGVFFGLQQEKIVHMSFYIYLGDDQNRQLQETFTFSFAYGGCISSSGSDLSGPFSAASLVKKLKKELKIRRYTCDKKATWTLGVHLEMLPMDVPLPFFLPRPPLPLDGDHVYIGSANVAGSYVSLQVCRPGKGKDVLIHEVEKNGTQIRGKTVAAYIKKTN